MNGCNDWLIAGSPPNYVQCLACFAWMMLEFVLPRMNQVRASSTIELIGNMLKPVLGKVPMVKKLINVMATKDEPAIEPKE